jgi:phosphatidylinositol alpha-1,6-mannosyltransferase
MSLLLAVNDFPPALGGEATLYHALARHLPAGSAVVLAPRGRGDKAIDAQLQIEVVRRWLPPHRGEISRIVRGLLAGVYLTTLIATRHVDYLACGQLLSLGAPASLLARLARMRYAVFVHGADLADYHARVPWGALARWILAGAHAVIANSRYTAALIERLLPGVVRRIVVLPMGVDPAPSTRTERSETLRVRYGLAGWRILLSVSRLVAMKGHDVVIAALPGLLARFPDLAYLIVGHGPHRAALEELAGRLGVRERVIFAGAVDRGELADHFRLATLFVQLSRLTDRYDGLEGFGLAFLEAASHGVPGIGGRTGGVPEAVLEGESGLLVDPCEPAAFAAAAARLLSDAAELRRMSEASRRWAASHSWESSARFLCSLAGED